MQWLKQQLLLALANDIARPNSRGGYRHPEVMRAMDPDPTEEALGLIAFRLADSGCVAVASEGRRLGGFRLEVERVNVEDADANLLLDLIDPVRPINLDDEEFPGERFHRPKA